MIAPHTYLVYILQLSSGGQFFIKAMEKTASLLPSAEVQGTVRSRAPKTWRKTTALYILVPLVCIATLLARPARVSCHGAWKWMASPREPVTLEGRVNKILSETPLIGM